LPWLGFLKLSYMARGQAIKGVSQVETQTYTLMPM
jgi:hypothetical protein